jgi:hypothetical protein
MADKELIENLVRSLSDLSNIEGIADFEAKEDKPLLQWVKASERLPQEAIDIPLKMIDGSFWIGHLRNGDTRYFTKSTDPKLRIPIQMVEWLEEVKSKPVKALYTETDLNKAFLAGEDSKENEINGDSEFNKAKWTDEDIRKAVIVGTSLVKKERINLKDVEDYIQSLHKNKEGYKEQIIEPDMYFEKNEP